MGGEQQQDQVIGFGEDDADQDAPVCTECGATLDDEGACPSCEADDADEDDEYDLDDLGDDDGLDEE